MASRHLGSCSVITFALFFTLLGYCPGCAATCHSTTDTPAQRLALAAFPDWQTTNPDPVYVSILWAGQSTHHNETLRAHYLPVGLLIVGPEESARQVVLRLGWGMFNSPADWLELTDQQGQPIQWAPGYADRGIPGTTVSLRRPGKHIAELLNANQLLLVEPWSAPVTRALEPGRYQIRIKPGAGPSDWLVNENWLEFEIPDQPHTEANPLKVLPDGSVRLSDGRIIAPPQPPS